MRLKYEQIADAIRVVYYEEGEKDITYTGLYKEAIRILRSKISHTYFLYVLNQMVLRNELKKNEDHNSKLKIKPTYYSLSPIAKKQYGLKIFGQPKADIYKRIYQKIFLYENWQYVHLLSDRNRDSDLKTVLSELGVKKSELIPIPANYPLQKLYYAVEFAYPRKIIERITSGFDTIEHINLLKSNAYIHIVRITSRWVFPNYKEPHDVWTNYSYVIEGFSIQEFMKSMDVSLEKFKLEDIKEALDILQEKNMVDILMIYNGQPRFGIMSKEFHSFIRHLLSLQHFEVILLIYKWVLSYEAPTEKEKQRLRSLFGVDVTKIFLHNVDEAKFKHKMILKTRMGLQEYNEHLKKDIILYPFGMPFRNEFIADILDLLLKDYKQNDPRLKPILTRKDFAKYNSKGVSNGKLLRYDKLIQKLIEAMLYDHRRDVDDLFAANNSQHLHLRSILGLLTINNRGCFH